MTDPIEHPASFDAGVIFIFLKIPFEFIFPFAVTFKAHPPDRFNTLTSGYLVLHHCNIFSNANSKAACTLAAKSKCF